MTYVVFQNRDFTVRQNPPVQFEVERLSRNAIGGMKQADITAKGDGLQMWELIGYLRCPVEIYNEFSEPVWWGYVHGVDINYGQTRVGISLDNVANSVKLSYTLMTGSTGAGTVTAATIDPTSSALYGTIEKTFTYKQASGAQGTAARDQLLNIYKYPIPDIDPNGGAGEGVFSASLYCKGWWDTLGWRYYAQAGTASTATDVQISTIATACGQFFGTVTVAGTSGISSNQYRDGTKTGLDELLELLQPGVLASTRYLAEVDRNRGLRIATEPAWTSLQTTMNRRGEIATNFGVPFTPMSLPIGWCQLIDMDPTVIGQIPIAQSSIFFIEESEWSRGGGYRVTARGAPAPYDLG